MSAFISSIVWRGLSEWLQENRNIERYRGRKAVLAVMSTDRNHPEFKKIEQYHAELQQADDMVLVAEDEPHGPLHDRFHCKPQEFCFALIDRDGNAVMRGYRVPSLQSLRQRLEMEHA
ncbi:MAG TPA: hypothetical protein VE954_13950 [Oligoflexus sp.]|uniref:hypothetical protein n=1 Tax=Oligoflexus sp. TaxID=1971216 RepID=UPI002D503C8E|nr:hypothetical protein [Oligoflexus sp.]HYX34203.1 hypothetical protein [Oligoflexus sp.]